MVAETLPWRDHEFSLYFGMFYSVFGLTALQTKVQVGQVLRLPSPKWTPTREG